MLVLLILGKERLLCTQNVVPAYLNLCVVLLVHIKLLHID